MYIAIVIHVTFMGIGAVYKSKEYFSYIDPNSSDFKNFVDWAKNQAIVDSINEKDKNTFYNAIVASISIITK